MSTSEFGYYVQMDTAKQIATSGETLDVVSSHTLINNINHLSDEAAQVRVTWGDTAGVSGGQGSNNPIMTWRFPITQRQSGDSYLFRIRIGGYATGGATVTFRAVLGPPNNVVGGLRTWSGAGDREFLTASSGSSSAWITGSSQGGAAWTTLVQVPSAVIVDSQTTTVATLGGSTAPLQMAMGQLTVYGSTSKTSDPPILTGVYLAEYVGV